jgi:thioredoxin 1
MAFVSPFTGATAAQRRLSCSPLPSLDLRRTSVRTTIGHARMSATGAPETVNADRLEEILKGNPGPVIVDCFATWCGPCQIIIPFLNAVAASMGDRVQVLKLNTDDNAEYATTIGVRALPTLYFIQDGELKYKMEGVVSAETLEEMAEHFFYGMILQRPVHLTFKRRLF